LIVSAAPLNSIVRPVTTATVLYRSRSDVIIGTNQRLSRLIQKKIMMTKSVASLLLLLFISGGTSTALAQKRKIIVDLIVRGGTVVTMDGSRRVIENGGVAVKSGRIVAVDKTAAIDRNYAAREVVNATGKVVIPASSTAIHTFP